MAMLYITIFSSTQSPRVSHNVSLFWVNPQVIYYYIYTRRVHYGSIHFAQRVPATVQVPITRHEYH